ncbi:transposase family protein [Actinacidiphila cocklensis]|uniref:helix-turn-helix domain-containing protein n=1 Tax=Actinacidiphila cocklensis TaxID=887465 RepID=UPI0027E2690A|nr:transposase family protein [Actinacidiphila cocklensis]
MVENASRAVIVSNRRITGLSAARIAELGLEVSPLWHERHQARLASRPRKRALGAGAKHRLVFIDRLLATLVHLRLGVTHDVLACWFGTPTSLQNLAVGMPTSTRITSRYSKGTAGPPRTSSTPAARPRPLKESSLHRTRNGSVFRSPVLQAPVVMELTGIGPALTGCWEARWSETPAWQLVTSPAMPVRRRRADLRCRRPWRGGVRQAPGVGIVERPGSTAPRVDTAHPGPAQCRR